MKDTSGLQNYVTRWWNYGLDLEDMTLQSPHSFTPLQWSSHSFEPVTSGNLSQRQNVWGWLILPIGT